MGGSDKTLQQLTCLQKEKPPLISHGRHKVELTLQQQSALEGLSGRVRSTPAPACCRRVRVLPNRHSSQSFIQSHRRILQVFDESAADAVPPAVVAAAASALAAGVLPPSVVVAAGAAAVASPAARTLAASLSAPASIPWLRVALGAISSTTM